MNLLCTICSDIINQADILIVTKCGHMFHQSCLAQWTKRSKTCPQCRNKIVDKGLTRVYPTMTGEAGDGAPELQRALDDAQLRIREEVQAVAAKDAQITDLNKLVSTNSARMQQLEKTLVTKESALRVVKEQLAYSKTICADIDKIKEENERLLKSIETMQGLQKVLHATSEEVEDMLKGYTDVRTVATFATALKRALCESESKKNEIRDRLQTTRQQYVKEQRIVTELRAKLNELKDKVANLKDDLRNMSKKRKASAGNEETCSKAKHTRHDDSEIIDVDMQDPQEVSTPRPASLNKPLDETKSFEFSFEAQGHSTPQPGISNKPESQERAKPLEFSFNTAVSKIENSSSPYFQLSRAPGPLAALHAAQSARQNANNNPLKHYKPVHTSPVKRLTDKCYSQPLSIFNKKPPAILSENCPSTSSLDMSYDGLGGHSKLDTFPVPTNRPVNTCIPRITAKHKLKRPTATGCKDIGKMLLVMKPVDK